GPSGERAGLAVSEGFSRAPSSGRVMARRKRKDEPTDWVAPDFDEVGYMRTEIQAAKTAVLTIAWAAVGAIVSFLLYSVNAALAFFAGIAVAVGLYYVLPFLGISVKGFKRRDWTGHGITYFFSWLAFWILLLNPPFATRAATSRRTPSISPASEAGRYRSHGNRLSKRRVHASACFDRRAATPEWMPTDFRAAFSRSLPRPRSRHFPLTSNSAVVA